MTEKYRQRPVLKISLTADTPLVSILKSYIALLLSYRTRFSENLKTSPIFLVDALMLLISNSSSYLILKFGCPCHWPACLPSRVTIIPHQPFMSEG